MSCNEKRISNVKYDNNIKDYCQTCVYSCLDGYCGMYEMVMGRNRQACEYYIDKRKEK